MRAKGLVAHKLVQPREGDRRPLLAQGAVCAVSRNCPPSGPREGTRAVEQASTLGWERYVGDTGQVVGMQTFGASAPLKELQEKFGFQPEQLGAVARLRLGRK